MKNEEVEGDEIRREDLRAEALQRYLLRLFFKSVEFSLTLKVWREIQK